MSYDGSSGEAAQLKDQRTETAGKAPGAGAAYGDALSRLWKRAPFYLLYAMTFGAALAVLFLTPDRDPRMLFTVLPLYLLARTADKRFAETEGLG